MITNKLKQNNQAKKKKTEQEYNVFYFVFSFVVQRRRCVVKRSKFILCILTDGFWMLVLFFFSLSLFLLLLWFILVFYIYFYLDTMFLLSYVREIQFLSLFFFSCVHSAIITRLLYIYISRIEVIPLEFWLHSILFISLCSCVLSVSAKRIWTRLSAWIECMFMCLCVECELYVYEYTKYLLWPILFNICTYNFFFFFVVFKYVGYGSVYVNKIRSSWFSWMWFIAKDTPFKLCLNAINCQAFKKQVKSIV